MAKEIQVKLVIAVDESGDWAVAAVKDRSRAEAVEEALADLSGENYSEVFELVLPVAVPKRPVRTIKLDASALQFVQAEDAVDDEENVIVEVAG